MYKTLASVILLLSRSAAGAPATNTCIQELADPNAHEARKIEFLKYAELPLNGTDFPFHPLNLTTSTSTQRPNSNKLFDDRIGALIAFIATKKTDEALDMIHNGANPNVLSKSYDHGINALMVAAAYGDVAVTQALIRAGSDINIRSLFVAAYNSHFNILRILLQANADIDHQRTNDNTAFIEAIRQGHLHVAQTLLSKGADPTLSNDHALDALIHGHSNIVALMDKKSSNFLKNNLKQPDRYNAHEYIAAEFVAPILAAASLLILLSLLLPTSAKKMLCRRPNVAKKGERKKHKSKRGLAAHKSTRQSHQNQRSLPQEGLDPTLQASRHVHQAWVDTCKTLLEKQGISAYQKDAAAPLYLYQIDEYIQHTAPIYLGADIGLFEPSGLPGPIFNRRNQTRLEVGVPSQRLVKETLYFIANRHVIDAATNTKGVAFSLYQGKLCRFIKPAYYKSLQVVDMSINLSDLKGNISEALKHLMGSKLQENGAIAIQSHLQKEESLFSLTSTR